MKPGRIVIDDEYRAKPVKQGSVPQELAIAKEIEEMENERIGTIQGLKNFLKKSVGVVGVLGAIILIGALYDAFITLSSMMSHAPLVGLLYGGLILLFVGLVGSSIWKQYRSYKKLKRVDLFQQKALKIESASFEQQRRFAKELLQHYQKEGDSQTQVAAQALTQELNTLLRGEIISRVEEKILAPLDVKAQDIITKYASQTAVSTAISPVAIIDAILILSRTHKMVVEIAKVYGFRVNLLGEMWLFKRLFGALAFASVTDILANHSHDLFGTSLLSKLSIHSAQGMANGILVARMGVGAMESCRPIPNRNRVGGFLKHITKSVAKVLFNKDK